LPLSKNVSVNSYFLWYSYLEFLQDLEKKVDQDWDSISSSLEEIRSSLLSKEGCLVNMTADGKNLTKSTFYIAKFLDSLPRGSSSLRSSFLDQLPPVHEAIVVPTQVEKFLHEAILYTLFIKK
jgi:presequence protease